MANKKIKKVDIGETICEAATILIEKQLERLQFDKTIEAIITDATRASEGIYTVSTGQASFLAYADKDDYKKDEEVMVTIPQGDYDKQKTIISRKIDFNQTEEPENYNSAFSTLIDIVNHEEDLKENGKTIKVNKAGEEYSWDTSIANFISSNAFIREGKNARLIKIDNKNLKDVFGENELVGYTRLGVKADFTSFLDSYNVVSGNYGLAFLIKFKHNETDEEILRQCFFDSKDFFGDVYNFIIPQTQETVFDISEYAENYHIEYIEIYLYQRDNFINTNGQLIDTSKGEDKDIVLNSLYLTLGIDSSEYVKDTAKIYTLDRDTYQKNINQEELFSQEELFNIKKDLCSNYITNYIEGLPNNSDTKNFLSGIEETLLNSLNDIDINKISNQEQIINDLIDDLNWYWVRKQKPEGSEPKNGWNYYNNNHPIFFKEDGPFYGFKMLMVTQLVKMKNEIISILQEDILEDIKTQKILEFNKKTIKLNWIHKDDITGNISRIQNDIPENYEIRWYYYKLGSPSADNFSGASWERFYGYIETQDKDGYYCRTSKDENGDIATNKVQVDFYPNVGKDTQQLKAIIIKKNIIESLTDGEIPLEEKVAESNIITLTNLDEVSNTATIIDLNALSIRYEDNEKGNYFLYDESRKIFTKESEKKRILKAVYDLNEENVYAKQALNNYSYIQWIFPANNTMIVPYFSESENNDIKVSTLLTEEVENNYQNNKAIPLLEANGYKYPYEIYYYKLDDTFRFEAKDIKEGNPLVEIKYSINSELDFSKNRNLVYLKITKDGQLFNASTQMFFGISGASGSNYNLFIRWDKDPYVFDINEGKLSGQIILTDQLSQEINIQNTNAQFILSWYKHPNNSDTIPDEYEIEDNKDIYYPLITNNLKPLASELKIDEENVNNRNLIVTKELDYYYVTYNFNDTNNSTADITTAVTYNLNTQSFQKIDINTQDDLNNYEGIIYCKLRNGLSKNKMKMIKLESTAFYQINKNQNNYHFYDGYIDLATNTFYYGFQAGNDKPSIRRPFIQTINGDYIIDPYVAYSYEQDYYIPIQIKKEPTDKCLQFHLEDNGKFTIFKEENVTNIDITKDLYILEVSLINFEDYKKIIARYPIPLKNSIADNLIVDHINGPTMIRYSTFGDIEYNNSPYSITYRQYSTSLNQWQQQIVNKNTSLGEWKLIWENNKEPSEKDMIKPILKNNQLFPPGCYFKNIPLYGISFVLNKNKTNEITLWTQPIYVYRDNYPSNTLNQWNGQDIINDNNTGTILANGFSAGKKEDDNSFTGVILGDWSRTTIARELSSQTGIYGFKNGIISYALKDDGTAFFGGDGQGRIYFDGKKAQIYSARWNEYSISSQLNNYNKYYEKNSLNKGMMLDIDDGIMKIISPNNKIDFNCIINSSEPNFLITYNSYDKDNKEFTQNISEGLNAKFINSFKLSLKSPYLILGPTKKTLIYSTEWDNGYTPGDNIEYITEWIRINENGGWLASTNFFPTMSDWFTNSSTAYHLSKRGKTPNSNNHYEIFPDNMSTSAYHCWGDHQKFPFRGLVIDLTHGTIVLGNDAEIKGYQTGLWGPENETWTSQNKITERVFHISNGAHTIKKNNILQSESNDRTNYGYFILAEQLERLPSQKNELPGIGDYTTVFRVGWDGQVISSKGTIIGSSQKFKKNIKILNHSELIHQLKSVSFQYKNSEKINYGFIAEDVYKILPEVVLMDDKNPKEVYGLDYNSIFTLAVAEIQQLRKELDILKQQVIKEENK